MAAGFMLLFFVFLLATSSIASAAGDTGGIVPCTGTDCQACDIVSLIQKIINFVIGLSIPIAIGLFAWAGVLYFTSAANPSGIEKAKKIFRAAFVGFLIALGGFLIIETILHTLLSEKYYKNWNTVTCVDPRLRPKDKSLSDLLKELPAYTPPSGDNGSTTPTSRLTVYAQANYGGLLTTFISDESTLGFVTGNAISSVKVDGSASWQLCQNSNYVAPCMTVNGDVPQLPSGYEDHIWSVKKNGSSGGTGFTYQSGISAQIGTASGALNNIISCMAKEVSGQISSISDSKIVSGHATWAQCRVAGQSLCAHHAGSCHYGGTCGDESYAVDIVGNNANIIAAAHTCNASFVLNEGSHVHVSVGAAQGCGCDNNGGGD